MKTATVELTVLVPDSVESEEELDELISAALSSKGCEVVELSATLDDE